MNEKDKLIKVLYKINHSLNMQNKLLNQLNEKISENLEYQDRLYRLLGKTALTEDNMYRLNNNVFNDRRQPLFSEPVNVFDLKTIGTGYPEGNASLAGKLYSTYSGSVTIDANKYADFYFNNPSGSGITAQFTCVFGEVRRTISVSVYKDVTSFSDTGTLTPRNNNPAFSDNSALTVRSAFNVATNPVSGGTALYYCIQKQPFFMEFKGALTLPPGHNCVIQFLNQGAETDTAAFDVRWWEIET
ncbi:hypothetical protein JOC37_001768 [Desulfohalotomaculum tongense]|uniref:hypothetical protein n=1 Tax=Desulforadius tongensis TaxID=1216062 RepID=UPI001958FE49|nr:hypothetical protein [Desulforadius tongensis]MBM7855374.1 hypothetical protein [Desulforadius tongensis]